MLVVFLQRPGGQSQFSQWTATGFVRHDELRSVLDAVALDPSADHSLEAMAARANFSPRHLARLFDDHLHMTPAQYLERTLTSAHRALRHSATTVRTAIAG